MYTKGARQIMSRSPQAFLSIQLYFYEAKIISFQFHSHFRQHVPRGVDTLRSLAAVHVGVPRGAVVVAAHEAALALGVPVTVALAQLAGGHVAAAPSEYQEGQN